MNPFIFRPQKYQILNYFKKFNPLSTTLIIPIIIIHKKNPTQDIIYFIYNEYQRDGSVVVISLQYVRFAIKLT